LAACPVASDEYRLATERSQRLEAIDKPLLDRPPSLRSLQFDAALEIDVGGSLGLPSPVDRRVQMSHALRCVAAAQRVGMANRFAALLQQLSVSIGFFLRQLYLTTMTTLCIRDFIVTTLGRYDLSGAGNNDNDDNKNNKTTKTKTTTTKTTKPSATTPKKKNKTTTTTTIVP
jgi:hypothetical protein